MDFLSIHFGTPEPQSIVFAVLVMLVAASKKRDLLLWAVLGFFFNCFALLLIICMSDLGALEDESRRSDRRRQSERQSKQKHQIESIQSEMRGRLDAHDMAIGLDTRRIKRALNRPFPKLANSPIPSWHYDDRGHVAGPVSLNALRGLIDSGTLSLSDLVWCEGLNDWIKANELKTVLS